jgi:luciferase-type oxidoreductase
MHKAVDSSAFQPINRGYNTVFRQGRLSLGLVVPLEAYMESPVPAMTRHLERFRESFAYIRGMGQQAPAFENTYGSPDGSMDMLPKPASGKLPLLITGGSQQAPDWIANNGDGWMLYPRETTVQANIIRDWRARVTALGGPAQPVMQPLYIDLAADDEAPPQPIHLGLRLGIEHLRAYLKTREQIGVNHVALNLRFNRADIETTLQRLAEEILPDFTD